MDLIDDVESGEWAVMGIVYAALLFAMWGPLGNLMGAESNAITVKVRIGFSIIMIPIIYGIVRAMNN